MQDTWREQWLARPENRGLSPEKLIAQALSRPLIDGDAYWSIVQTLHLLGGAAVCEAACHFCESTDPVHPLITLSGATDEDVRDWATFGLGTQSRTDTPELRNALLARVTDPHADTRAEALVGLAQRMDERVVPYALHELQSDCVGTLAVEAARMLADPRFQAALLALQEWWGVDTALLAEALAACQAPDSNTGGQSLGASLSDHSR